MPAIRRLVEEPHARVQLRGRFLRPWWQRRFAAFGEGSVLDRPRWLSGTQEIAIGSRCIILSGAWLAAERDAWGSGEPAIQIGDDVAINTGVTITAAQRVTIEDGVLMAANVTIVDCDHTMHGEHVNPAFNPLVSSAIRIGRSTWLGQNATVLRGSTIGERCVIAAGAIVRGEIPPRSIAVGAPARVVGSIDD